MACLMSFVLFDASHASLFGQVEQHGPSDRSYQERLCCCKATSAHALKQIEHGMHCPSVHASAKKQHAGKVWC